MSKNMKLKATFYGRAEDSETATGEFGVTLREALAGEEPLQCAVDPGVIPLHTEFTLKLWDGQEVSAKALDTGDGIDGRRIDILVETEEEADPLGEKFVTAILDDGAEGSGDGHDSEE
jgi:3D (Asp-Asp-Asp) domain-containing protein